MSCAHIAKGLVGLVKEGRHLDAIEQYYSDNIVSVEPVGSEEMPAELQGIDAIRGKNQWWAENTEVHDAQVNGPFVGENQFAVHYAMDVTNKPSGQRMQMSEVGVYTVEGDKIVREEFFYNAPGQ